MLRFNRNTLEYDYILPGCFAEVAVEPVTVEPAAPPPELTEEPPAAPEPVVEADWRALVTDDAAKVEAEHTTDLNAAFNRISGLRKELAGAVRVPGKDADDDAIATYRKAIGVPESADDYAFPELPEAELTDAIKEERADWAKTFQDNNISTEAAAVLTDKLFEQQAEAMKAVQVEDKRFADEQTDALKKDWGGDHDKNIAFANRAFETVAGRAQLDVADLKKIEMKDGKFLLDNADVLRLFSAIGRDMGEGRLAGGMSESESENATTEINGLQEKIEAAQAKGDGKEANRLYQMKLSAIEKRDGIAA